LDKLAGTLKHQGIVALCSVKPYDTMNVLIERINKALKPPIILVPASIEDPRNLGAIIRSSVAFDVFALLIERKKTSPLTSTVAKTSTGMLEYMSIVKPHSLEKEIRFLRRIGFSIFGIRNKNDKRLDQVDFTKPCVIITGGENKGIPPYLQKLCAEFIGIPVTKYTDSLNVSVAASIILYEISKQRQFKFNL
jgi:23S rRNA (guanosine2251-2'-O)-methyltransferase